ncbi:MAG: ABC transporter permease [Zoogloeaceae bacterium]|jgi:lipooligosaccharide transport system permease protein|nr:ABC transporter permease [Zoogloeaceae bacterium]
MSARFLFPGRPALPTGWVAVWRRNFFVWRKQALPAVLGNLADPMIYMFGLGYGLGGLLPSLEGQPYVAFLAAGVICASTMNAASFEALYSAFARMREQRTWEAILNTPLGLADVLLGEMVWAASKAFLSGAAILLVIALMGLARDALALWALPTIFLTGLAFAALGLVFTTLASSYGFFMYYFTLFITPMTLISGVFFPDDQLPVWLATLGAWLPLAHGVALTRPLLHGDLPPDILAHIAALLLITLVAWRVALTLARRRLM